MVSELSLDAGHHFRKTIHHDCFRNCRFIYCFKKRIDAGMVDFLRTFGEVKVFDDFPKPLIKADIPRKFRMIAIMGEHDIDVFFKENAPKGFVEEFERGLDLWISK